jgi:phosphoribosylanthranilate isomerase
VNVVRVKICGFTNPTDIVNACAAGADMIGVIVDTPAPRSVSLVRAKIILSAVPKNVDRVLVMVPRDVDHVIQIARELQPDCVQIHATMMAAEFKEIKNATGARLIAVVGVPKRVKHREEILVQALEAAKVADYVLVDTKHPGVGGGTGRTHDWNTSRAVREAIDKPLILAGGLNPKNVRKAIETVGPYGVDVASGVESELGKKDPELMKKFIKAARG